MQFSGNGDLGIEVIYSDSAEVALMGELDIAAVPALREQLSEVVTQGWIDIAVDIAELRYIDWPGVSVLIMTQNRVEELNGSLVVRHPTKAALKLFDSTGLTARLVSTGRANDLIRLEAARPG
jgi:anti-anti-sigma factor